MAVPPGSDNAAVPSVRKGDIVMADPVLLEVFTDYV
jgi:hypothetical protein